MSAATPVNTEIHRARCRETGATIVVVRTGPGSFIEEEAGWETVCEDHSNCCLHYSRKDALSHAAQPSGWCEDCRAIAEGRELPPACVSCGERDETVAQRPVTRTTQALLCAACGDSDEVLRLLAEEDQ